MVTKLISMISVFRGIKCFLIIVYDNGLVNLTQGSSEDIQMVIAEARKNGDIDELVDSMIKSDKLSLKIGDVVTEAMNSDVVFSWEKK